MDTEMRSIARNQTPFQDLQDQFLLEIDRSANLEVIVGDDLRSFKNGTLVERKQPPWDQNGLLQGGQFYIMHKTFDVHGRIVFITLRGKANYHDYMMGSELFSGWSIC